MPGIKDVARACGLSAATVSQVLGDGKRPVSDATRVRVLQAAAELNYRPNAIARGLVKKRMNTIGVVIQHEAETAHTNPALGAILDGILSVGTRCHQQITLVTYRSWQDANDALPTVCDGRCDGVLLAVPPLNAPLIAGLLDHGLPFVLIGAQSTDPRVSSVDVDNFAGAETVVSFLLDQGHRRIALMSGFLETHQFDMERVAGYKSALQKAGVEIDPSLIMLRGNLQEDSIKLIAMPESQRPTALFCTTDAAALAAMRRMMDSGVRIPEDISVAGFDDIPTASVSYPMLTTLHQPMAGVGERAAEILLSRLDNAEMEPQQIYLPTSLVVRASVAPLI